MGTGVDVGIAKIGKYAVRESGDTVEVVERPGGGISIVLVDGQGSGAAAKALSHMLTARAVAMIKDGVRDGAVARAVNDTLFAFRGGQVSATLDILSVDLKHGRVLATRNATAPMAAIIDGTLRILPEVDAPIGRAAFVRPAISSLPIQPGLLLCAVSDGVVRTAGRAENDRFDLLATLSALSTLNSSQEIADAVLGAAVRHDQGRPRDDMTVICLRIAEISTADGTRRMQLQLPLAQ